MPLQLAHQAQRHSVHASIQTSIPPNFILMFITYGLAVVKQKYNRIILLIYDEQVSQDHLLTHCQLQWSRILTRTQEYQHPTTNRPPSPPQGQSSRTQNINRVLTTPQSQELSTHFTHHSRTNQQENYQ